MNESKLMLHCGARQVERADLELVPTPEATASWYPVSHSRVVDTVGSALTSAGFSIRQTRFGLSRGDQRLFATMDLEASLGSGINLSVGIRNSLDKSLPLGFIAGSRVFVCDNLAFRSELLVRRKHTRFGHVRFQEAICSAVQSLNQFRVTETLRIERLQHTDVNNTSAESLILRAYEAGIVSHLLLPTVLKEWREPSHEEFQPRNLWSLTNAFTHALAPRQVRDPQRFAAQTIRLQELIGRDAGIRPESCLAA